MSIVVKVSEKKKNSCYQNVCYCFAPSWGKMMNQNVNNKKIQIWDESRKNPEYFKLIHLG